MTNNLSNSETIAAAMTTNPILPSVQGPVTPPLATEPEPTNPARGTASVEKPFIWQAKAALRRIRDAFDHLTFLNQAIAVYLTLTEFASDAHSETFTRRRREIAERSGVSVRLVQIILNIFKQIGIVTWVQNQGAEGTLELAPSTYTLCSVCPTQCTCNPQVPGSRSFNPPCASVRLNLGDAYRNIGNIDQAIRHYKDVIRLRPNNADAHSCEHGAECMSWLCLACGAESRRSN